RPLTPPVTLRTLHSSSSFTKLRPPPKPTLFPFTTLFPSGDDRGRALAASLPPSNLDRDGAALDPADRAQPLYESGELLVRNRSRSEEHTSELQSLTNLVCRLLLENKKTPRRL